MAGEAGTYVTRAMMDLACTAQSDTVRLQAALELWTIGKKKEAKPVLQKLAKKRGAGTVRIDAALALPEAVDELIAITEDHREKETVRVDAGVKAKEKDEERGRQALRKLADDRKISETTRKKVLQHLKQ
jgi:hypothetical protein